MERVALGNTGLEVSRLCFGTLAVSPLQKNCSPQFAADLMSQAYEWGVNFFDSAEIYLTYKPLALLLQRHPQAVVVSKSYAVTAAEMERSVERARQSLNRDYLDLFLLHEVENGASLRGHRGALDYLYQAKAKGIIKAVGLSTHTIAGVRAGASEPGIEVIHALLNQAGIGIKDGSADQMVAALRTAKEFGKGIYVMKALAGGHLSAAARTALQYVGDLDCVDAVAVGIQSLAELQLDLMLLAREEPDLKLSLEVGATPRQLHVAAWCQRCGRCVAECRFGALKLVEDKLRVNQQKCLHCGYCARICPDFCLKIV